MLLVSLPLLFLFPLSTLLVLLLTLLALFPGHDPVHTSFPAHDSHAFASTPGHLLAHIPNPVLDLFLAAVRTPKCVSGPIPAFVHPPVCTLDLACALDLVHIPNLAHS
jgi:hypothetical protein